MIFIKSNNGNVEIAGNVANQLMLDNGYFEYNGIVPVLKEHQYMTYVNGVLIAVDDNISYTKDISDKIQEILDKKAIELRYDNMLSARALAGIPLIGDETVYEVAMYNEALKLARWYLSCWGKASEIEQNVINSVIIRPTISEIIDQLPMYA